MAVKRRKDSNGRVLPDGVTQRSDGRYLYRSQFNGKTVYIYDTDLNSLKEKILAYKVDLANGRNIDLGKMTLDDWATQYFELFKKDKLKPTTYYNTVSSYRRYISEIGTLGSMKIKEIRRTHIVAHYKKLLDKKHLADGTLKSLSSMLYGMFQQLVFDNVLPYNPMEKISQEIKGEPAEVREALEEDEVKTLIEFLKVDKIYNIYLPMVVVALGTGLRVGELLGLTYDDVDFKEGIIRVNKNMQYKNRGKGKTEQFVSTVKTVSGYREIPMTSEVAEMFKAQKKYQKEMRIRDDVTIDGYKGFVFTTKLGTPFTNDAVGVICKRFTKAANKWEEQRAKDENRKPVNVPEHSPHYWRHTFCTRLVEAEVGYLALKEYMGHSRIETSINIYTTISRKLKKKNRESLENVIKIL